MSVMADLLILYLVSLAFGYVLRFTEATRYIGRELSGSDSPTGFQDAITPPAFSNWSLGVLGLSVAVIVLGFYRYGFLRGLAGFVVFSVLVIFNRIFVLPKPESSYFRTIVLRSMIRRYANFLRDGDLLRAAVMADLLQRTEMPINDLIQPVMADLLQHTEMPINKLIQYLLTKHVRDHAGNDSGN